MNKSELIAEIEKLGEGAGYGGWSAEKITIGKICIEGMAVHSREGMINFLDGLDRILQLVRRRAPGAPPDQHRVASPMTRLLSVEIESYVSAESQRGVTDAHYSNVTTALRILLAAAGDIPVSQIDHSHITTMCEYLRWWPRHCGHNKALKGKSSVQIIDWAKANNINAPSPVTINNRMARVRGFFAWLIERRVLAHCPCAGVRPTIVGAETKRRRAFSDAEIAAIFDPSRFGEWASKYPHRWWMPMIGLFTGARVNEVAQLKVADVERLETGEWVFKLRKSIDDDLQDNPRYRTRSRVKNEASQRVVPIARELLEAGFLEFVEDMRRTRHPRLFPHLNCAISKRTGLPSGQGYSGNFKHQFSAYLEHVPGVDLHGFHAFRHRFITVLKGRRVEKDVIRAMVGHVSRGDWKDDYSLIDMVYTDDFLMAEIKGRPILEHINALERLRPPAALPRYVRGQFDDSLGQRAKLFP